MNQETVEDDDEEKDEEEEGGEENAAGEEDDQEEEASPEPKEVKPRRPIKISSKLSAGEGGDQDEDEGGQILKPIKEDSEHSAINDRE